ncbi:MAG: ion transporter [Firmicutes bacterium]|nr:ion transporter [Bacillota bacterium]
MSDAALKKQKRIFEIIEVGNDLDYPSRIYDFVNAFSIIFNITACVLYTFEDIRVSCGSILLTVEQITVAFFMVDYLLRLWTARFLYPEFSEKRARKKYVLSFTGIIDLLSFLPYYLPIFFPSGTAAFRMIRIVRIFRLFKINAYYDSLSVISEVISGKRQQLFSSVFIILVLMVASSLCMYSLEHEAQPEVFTNAFSGIWWSASTLLTVGYGDIYPITTMGKILSIAITFLGVGMVAIPTGIISAGFVDQYSTIKKRSEIGYSADMNFIKIFMNEGDSWVGKKIMNLGLPAGVIVAIVRRNGDNLIPRGSLELRAGDTIVIGSEPYNSQEHIKLKELVLEKKNPWTGELIRDLDISRHSIIVLVKRGNKSIIPNGNMRLEEGDKVFLYTHLHLAHTNEFEI